MEAKYRFCPGALVRRSRRYRFGIEQAVDLALAGVALLRFGNVLEIDIHALSGTIRVIMRHARALQ
jgi:hypothetical protein